MAASRSSDLDHGLTGEAAVKVRGHVVLPSAPASRAAPSTLEARLLPRTKSVAARGFPTTLEQRHAAVRPSMSPVDS
jgi:hypothetical protein